MKYNVYMLSYNNYYNRQVKQLSSILDYINAGCQVGQTVLNVNFEFKDGIVSELLVNQAFVDTEPDYLLIAERGEGGVETGNFSRWFVIDSNLIRGNQYKFTVKRDICVDYNDLLLNSHYFIERGWIIDKNSDLLFNNENQKYSQIKIGQTPLYDETGCAWIVGYMDKKWSGGTMSAYINIGSEVNYTAPNGISNWTINGTNVYNYVDMTGHHSHSYINADTAPDNFYMCINMPTQNTTLSTANGKYNMVHYGIDLKTLTATNSVIDSDWVDSRPYTGIGVKKLTQSEYNNKLLVTYWKSENTPQSASYKDTLYYRYLNYLLDPNPLLYSNLMNACKAACGLTNADKELAETLYYNYNGKTIKDENTGKIYRIQVMINTADGQFFNYTTSDDLYTTGRAFVKSALSTAYGDVNVTIDYENPKTTQFDLYYHYNKYYIILTEEIPVVLSISNSRKHSLDAAYDMFCLPYGNLNIKYTSGGVTSTVTMTPELSMNIAQSIAIQGGTNIYDLQILPYCPMRDCIKWNGSSYEFDMRGLESGQYETIVDQSAGALVMGFMFYPANAQQLSYQLRSTNGGYYSKPQFTDAYAVKKDYNTKMYRLSSPNFASSFEFSMAMNDGIEYYLISYTYKPFNPYIRIRPKFNRMYKQDYQDGRGLILQGDFSIPTLTDNWINWEIQNKNYLNTFNREIDSMELQNSIGKTEDIVKAITGSITGAVSGAMAGGVAGSLGGPVGTAVGAIGGAVVGGVTSAIGGIVDVANNQTLRNDAIDKAKELFNYQLDNIKALPRTIRNIGCFTADFTLVPVLEEYEASPDEIETFDLKMQWNGMSIMRPGTILEYLKNDGETFIQGYLVRLENEGVDIPEEADNHLAEEISSEVSKGLYIGG